MLRLVNVLVSVLDAMARLGVIGTVRVRDRDIMCELVSVRDLVSARSGFSVGAYACVRECGRLSG